MTLFVFVPVWNWVVEPELESEVQVSVQQLRLFATNFSFSIIVAQFANDVLSKCIVSNYTIALKASQLAIFFEIPLSISGLCNAV